VILDVAGRRFAGAAVALVALAIVAVACSGGGSPSVQPGDGSAGAGDPESVALNILEALAKGSGADALQWVRPDKRQYFDVEREMGKLKGCDLEGVETLVDDLGPIFGTNVVAVVNQPCGVTGLDEPCRSFEMNLKKLSGKWYLDVPEIACRS
jgi:hypothetical protein